jgi:hypothetical protein
MKKTSQTINEIGKPMKRELKEKELQL